MSSAPIADRLRTYVTPSSPLGPSDAAQITDDEVAAKLFDIHNQSFYKLLRRDLSVLIGRRGSGKTALLNSYKYRKFLDRDGTPATVGNTSDFRSYDVVIDAVTYKQFEDMQKLVVRDPERFRTIEAVVDDWESLITDYFFAKFIMEEVEGGRKTDAIVTLNDYLHHDEDDYKRDVREMVWGRSLRDKIKALFHLHGDHHANRLNRADALEVAVRHLDDTKRRALVVFDSMDEYDVGNVTFNRTLGALIRFISHFNSRQDRVKIKLGLPSEIFPEVTRASANALKDLINVDQLSWTAIELAQIAAHRFRLFLELYDPDTAVGLNDLDLDRRADVHEFWTQFFPKVQLNRYGEEEEPLTYILRHTQLLPRQFLVIVQRIIMRSYAELGHYRKCQSSSIAEAIEGIEPLIASEILHAFAHVYPFAEALCRPVFGDFPTVFSFDELENKWRKKGRPVAKVHVPDLDVAEFTEMVVRMGIVGVGQEEKDRYYEGSFAYDSLAPLNIGEGNALCLHPIFSRHFNAAGNEKKKAVIPKGVAGIRWGGR